MVFVSLGYFYYRYKIGGPEAEHRQRDPTGYERQGIRLAMSTFVPLFGSFGTAR